MLWKKLKKRKKSTMKKMKTATTSKSKAVPSKLKSVETKYTLFKLDYEITSEEYHGTPGTFSSSQLKDILEEDTDLFYKKWISKEIPRKESDAFDLGTYVHTAVLEPEKLSKECAVYTGKVKAGDKWKEFKSKHAGKVIITQAQAETADKLSKAVFASKPSMELITAGTPEVSLFVELGIDPETGEIIYRKTPGSSESMGLMPNGEWVPVPNMDKRLYVWVILKVRADDLCEDGGFILDLKTTSSNAKSEEECMKSTKYYNYDLSAALYVDLFNIVLEGSIRDFYWTYVSKTHLNCRTHRALPETLMTGRAKWMKAAVNLARGIKNNWKSIDTIGEIGPDLYDYSKYVLKQSKQSDSDLL
jgi:PDDEXK-like domain of unknown function (DUF3799)